MGKNEEICHFYSIKSNHLFYFMKNNTQRKKIAFFWEKNLQVQKKAVPLHSQMRASSFEDIKWCVSSVG